MLLKFEAKGFHAIADTDLSTIMIENKAENRITKYKYKWFASGELLLYRDSVEETKTTISMTPDSFIAKKDTDLVMLFNSKMLEVGLLSDGINETN